MRLVDKKLSSRLKGDFQPLYSLRLTFETPVALEPNRKVFVNNSGNNSWRVEIQNFFAPMKMKEIYFRE
jgi:hypothetical protein